MVHLRVLSGKRVGAEFCGANFPILVGRLPDAHLYLEEPGVWPRHFQISWDREGLIIESNPEALLEINGAPVQRAILRNGDTILAGGITLRFSLSPLRQSSLAWREGLTWAGLVLLCAFQAGLIWLLPR